jgi:hypothetical protein
MVLFAYEVGLFRIMHTVTVTILTTEWHSHYDYNDHILGSFQIAKAQLEQA